VASERKTTLAGNPKSALTTFGPVLYVVAAVLVLGAGGYGYLRYLDRQFHQELELTPEAKAYARNLKLSDVEMKATESYMKQRVVEIDGKISNAGDRPLEMVEIFCIFRDPYGQLVLRKRLPIVSPRMGGLKPGDTKSFRLPFDEIPESWNQAMPNLVIAAVKFP
jgi:hypothetical protein